MLYKRYGDPLSLLSTFSMTRLMDFILYLFEMDNEDQIWQMWLAKDIEQTFADFKKDNLKKLRQPVLDKPVDKEQIKANIDMASKYIKQRKEVD